MWILVCILRGMVRCYGPRMKRLKNNTITRSPPHHPPDSYSSIPVLSLSCPYPVPIRWTSSSPHAVPSRAASLFVFSSSHPTFYGLTYLSLSRSWFRSRLCAPCRKKRTTRLVTSLFRRPERVARASIHTATPTMPFASLDRRNPLRSTASRLPQRPPALRHGSFIHCCCSYISVTYL